MAPHERLAFSFGGPAVPGAPAATAAAAPHTGDSFPTAARSEPRDWGYTGLLAFTTVLLLRPQDHVPGLASLHLAELFALAGVMPMVVHRFVRRLPVFRVTPETVTLTALGVVMLGVAPFSIWPGGAVQEVLNSYLKVLLVFVLMMNTLTTPRRIERFAGLVLVCAGIVAAEAVFDWARGQNLVEGGRLAGPVGGIFGNPNDLATNMVAFMPLGAILAMSRRHATVLRLAGAGAFVLMLATVVFSQSRGGFLGLAVMVLTLALLTRTVRPAFGAAVLAAVVLAAPFLPHSFWDRMETIVNPRQDELHYTGSREARWTVMQEGIYTFATHPFTGVGPGQFPNYNYPGRQEKWREAHNVLIQVAADTGIAGLLLFCLLLARAGYTSAWLRRRLRPVRRRRGAAPDGVPGLTDDERHTLHVLAIALTAGLAGWFTCALFASVAYSWTFYYLLAFLVASRELVRDRATETAPAPASPTRRHRTLASHPEASPA